MPGQEAERTVRQSVIDRLIDREPRSGTDVPMRWSQSVSALKTALRRDLEWLLNTRRGMEEAPDGYSELRRSVFQFGLPDFTGLGSNVPDLHKVLAREITECLEIFEPRLMNVRVMPVESTDETKRQIRFHIEALLRMDPNPERVMFDTVLESASGKILVTGDTNA